MRVVATAGHVDHGKSALVRWLTGTDPDRFAEEQRRGMTIDLGFAHTTLPDGEGISFVDVPGHVRFIGNMLAGVGGVDACVLAVAATEGWKPQTEEHLRILELVGVHHGLVVLTMRDLVDDEWLQLQRLDVEDHLAGSVLAGAEIVAVSALTGAGHDELRAALERLVARTPPATDRQRPRLWVDRSFAARGSGTVVTGTLTGGAVHADQHLDVLPRGRRGRVRAIQTHGERLDAQGPGQRVALNLVGIDHGDVGRGDAVLVADQWRPTQRFDATLHVLAGLDHDVAQRGAYVAHIGSGEHSVRLRVLQGTRITPGTDGLVRVHLPAPLPLVAGDRFVLRDSGRSETVGGGEVLDVDPVLPASRAHPDRDVWRMIAERGPTDVTDVEALTGARVEPTAGRWAIAPATYAAMVEELTARIDDAGTSGLDLAIVDDVRRAIVARLDGVTIVDGIARRAGTTGAWADHPLLDRLAAGGMQPPEPTGVARNEIRELARRGLIVERDGICFHHVAIEGAADLAGRLLDEEPAGFTTSRFREAAGITRKYAIPLLTELDARGVTRRRADLRVAGPRLPRAGDLV
ncbi:MAG: selenocysteine-specific translation elongation factor [Ilumatobacteraceae bacterium]